MTVTDIIEISKKQCKIMIDNEFAFVLYKGELHLYKIKKGTEIAKEDYDKIINEVLVKRARLRAMNLLKSRAYTEKKLRDKLKAGHYPSSCIEDALGYVKSYGYIDDKKYTEDYLFYHGRELNRQQVFMKLKERGIAEETIRKAYEDFCQSGEAPDESELICKLLKKKHYDPAGDWESRQKIMRFLFTKGFSYDKIQETLSVYGKNDE